MPSYIVHSHMEPQHRWLLTVLWIYLCNSCPLVMHTLIQILPSFYCAVLPFFLHPSPSYSAFTSIQYEHLAFSACFFLPSRCLPMIIFSSMLSPFMSVRSFISQLFSVFILSPAGNIAQSLALRGDSDGL